MRFSVVIPLYNKAPYVKKALDSIIGQSFPDFDLVVVDDGSTDGSYDIADSVLRASGIKFQLIHQVNAGVSTARNNGVALSSGDYLCFLDADDWWDPAFLERMNWLIKTYPDAGIYGTNYYYVKNGLERVCVKSAETGYINYCRIYSENLAMPLTSSSVSIPRVVFDNTGKFRPQLTFGEDFDLWIRIALRYKVVFLNEPLAFYYQDSDPQWRGIGRLVDPKHHMLWNLDYLHDEELSNADYKNLIDTLRCHGLLPYFLSTQYRLQATDELKKVNWSLQPKKVRILYKLPIVILIIRRSFLSLGSRIKQWIKRTIVVECL